MGVYCTSYSVYIYMCIQFSELQTIYTILIFNDDHFLVTELITKTCER